MELIESLLKTNQSNELKESGAYKLVMRTVVQPMTSQECRKVFFRLTDLIISSEQKFLRETALKGLDDLVDRNFSVFQEIVDPIYFKMIFANMKHTNPVELLSLVMTIFSKFEKSSITQSLIPICTAVRTGLVLYLGHHGNNPAFLQSLAQLYNMFPTLLPVTSQDVTKLGNIVVHLHSSHPPNCHCSTGLDSLLSHVWTMYPDTTGPCLDTLQTVYRVLSTRDSSYPPACLSTVLEAVSPALLEQALPVILSQPQERLVLVLTRLFAWLEDRPSSDLARHLLSALTVLGRARACLVASVSQICLVRLVQQVIQVTSSCRDQLARLVLLILYGDQQSQAAFQSILPLLPRVLEVMAKEEMWETRGFLLEAAQYFNVLFPGMLASSPLETLLQEENVQDLSDERRRELAGLIWSYPGQIQLDRRLGQLVGLVNLGNTCYMNCILQALFRTNMFLSQVMASRSQHAQKVISSLQRVFRCLKLSKRSIASPDQFLDISRPSWFEPGQQQDCSEFCTFLLHSLEEEEKRMVEVEASFGGGLHWEKDGGENVGESQSQVAMNEDAPGQCNYSHDSGVDTSGEVVSVPGLVQSVFGGQLDTSYQCVECSNTSQGVTSFTELHLPIPAQNQKLPDMSHLPHITIARSRRRLTLEDLIRNFLAPEELYGDNQYQCDSCHGLREAVKTTQIKAPPQHLIITLLRFKYDLSRCQKVKMLVPVECPDILSLPVSGGEEVRYQLYSVVVHSGQSSEVGHYYTWVRGREKEEWHKISDQEVETVPGCWDQGLHSRRDTPYLLFYRREGLV